MSGPAPRRTGEDAGAAWLAAEHHIDAATAAINNATTRIPAAERLLGRAQAHAGLGLAALHRNNDVAAAAHLAAAAAEARAAGDLHAIAAAPGRRDAMRIYLDAHERRRQPQQEDPCDFGH